MSNNFIKDKYRIFNSYHLKLIAMISMLLDHFAYAVIYYSWYVSAIKAGSGNAHGIYLWVKYLRFIGRLSFPLFVFLLVEGFIYTKNIKKYALRLLALALISEVPYDLLFRDKWISFDKQNVVFSLLSCLVMLYLLHNIRVNDKISMTVSAVLQVLIIAAFGALAYFANFDYSYNGIILAAVLYYLHGMHPISEFCGAVSMSYKDFQLPAILAFFLMLFYNGKKGKNTYLFYLVYPVHLIILYLIKDIIPNPFSL